MDFEYNENEEDQLDNFEEDSDLTSSSKCKKCKKIITTIIDKSKDSTNEVAVKHSITKGCKYLSGFFTRMKCRIFVRWNKKKILKYILKKPDPEYVCSKLGKCD